MTQQFQTFSYLKIVSVPTVLLAKTMQCITINNLLSRYDLFQQLFNYFVRYTSTIIVRRRQNPFIRYFNDVFSRKLPGRDATASLGSFGRLGTQRDLVVQHLQET